ncbi:PadR family transcriptional regulator [Kitasatospora sp. NPDC090308]|uniref:PadR family transcriptional regulator n=1 Tax=Kitasatospora sp. NPDC090308 TaxID=3364082 RepID=UPI003818176E
MSLPHAILTALLEKPSSGLELTRRFDRSIGFFWSATHQQIYRELGRLEREGLVRASGPGAGRGQRKEYEVLPEGRAELARWTALAQDPKPVRDPLLLRLRAAAVLGAGGLEAELARHRELHRAQLAEYLEIERRDFPPERAGTENRPQHLVLRAGIQLESFWLAWLDEALAGRAGDGAGPAGDGAGPSGEGVGPGGSGAGRAGGGARPSGAGPAGGGVR